MANCFDMSFLNFEKKSNPPKRKAGALGSLGECPICLEQKTDNRLLIPCGHGLCFDCLEKLISQKNRHCPHCKKEFKPHSKASNFVKDYQKNSLVEFLLQEKSQAELTEDQAWDQQEKLVNELAERILVLEAKLRECEQLVSCKNSLKELDNHFDKIIEQVNQAREKGKEIIRSQSEGFTTYEVSLREGIQSCKSLRKVIQDATPSLFVTLKSSLQASIEEVYQIENRVPKMLHTVFVPNPLPSAFGDYAANAWTPTESTEELWLMDLRYLTEILTNDGTIQQKLDAVAALKSYCCGAKDMFNQLVIKKGGIVSILLKLLEQKIFHVRIPFIMTYFQKKIIKVLFLAYRRDCFEMKEIKLLLSSFSKLLEENICVEQIVRFLSSFRGPTEECSEELLQLLPVVLNCIKKHQNNFENVLKDGLSFVTYVCNQLEQISGDQTKDIIEFCDKFLK